MRALIATGSTIFACLALACSDSTSPLPVPASLQIVSGNAQHGTVGAELSGPLVIRVLDADLKPIAGQQVNFNVTAGGGTLSAASGVTDANGRAQDRWTLGNVISEPQTVEASVAVDQSHSTRLVATFGATPGADAPDTVRIISGDGQTAFTGAALADSLLARVVDRFGNPVAGAVVAWSISADGGTLSRTTDLTTTTGYTRDVVTTGSKPGDYTVSASVNVRSANFTVHVARRPLTIHDLVGRRILQSISGNAMPWASFPAPEKELIVIWGELEVLSNGTAVVTETQSLTEITNNDRPQPEVTVQSRALVLKGDSVFFGESDKGIASDMAIILNSSVGRVNGERRYGQDVFATELSDPGPATSLVMVSGNAQQAPYWTTLPAPLVVRALDAAGQPVAGQKVRFRLRIGDDGAFDNGLYTEDVVTDGGGQAQVQWKLGSYTAAPQQVTAMSVSQAAGVPPSVVWFTATAIR